MGAIETFTFEGKEDGPHILFTGRIHGNEPAGEIALKRLKARLENGDVELKRGKVTLIPCCNPEAAKANKRFIDVNLNRLCSHKVVEDHKDSYEASLALEIMDAIDGCDYSVDLHTVTEDMGPFVICIDDQNATAQKLAEAAGIKRIVCDSPLLTEPGRDKLLNYARHHAKPAILIECGQHNDQEAIETGWHSILNILIANDMVKGRAADPIKHDYIIIETILFRREGEKLLFPLMEKDRIERGDDLFEMADGTVIRADMDGFLFMRNPNTPVNEEYAFVCHVREDWP